VSVDAGASANDNSAMTLNVPRMPISLDLLMAEAKRRMRQRRLLVGALIVALAAAVAGASFALRGHNGPGGAPAGSGHGLATATMGQLSMLYPAAWKQVKWTCWIGVGNYLLFTTARPTPTCGGTLPPPEQLGRDGVAAWFGTAGPLRRSVSRQLVANPNPIGLYAGTKRVTCAAGAGPRRRLGARLQGGSFDVVVGAVVCGPDYGKGEGALERMLASARFRK
jgi:hypothetical protein